MGIQSHIGTIRKWSVLQCIVFPFRLATVLFQCLGFAIVRSDSRDVGIVFARGIDDEAVGDGGLLVDVFGDEFGIAGGEIVEGTAIFASVVFDRVA